MISENETGMSNEKIRERVIKYSSEGRLPCKRALDAAEALCVDPAAIGRHADELGIKLVACQLGLFGYRPEKKVVKPAAHVSPVLAAAIRERIIHERLPCRAAFSIAREMGMDIMDVSSACEALGVFIKPCQLGAF